MENKSNLENIENDCILQFTITKMATFMFVSSSIAIFFLWLIYYEYNITSVFFSFTTLFLFVPIILIINEYYNLLNQVEKLESSKKSIYLYKRKEVIEINWDKISSISFVPIKNIIYVWIHCKDKNNKKSKVKFNFPNDFFGEYAEKSKLDFFIDGIKGHTIVKQPLTIWNKKEV